LKAMVGIPVFNEQRNIGDLLRALEETRSDARIGRICIVSSSTDSTENIVRAHSLLDQRIELITERRRRGKANAWNKLVDVAEAGGFDSLVCLGGDNRPYQNGISLLLDELEKGLDIVGGRPIPVDTIGTFLGWHINLLWNMHHCMSRKIKPKISGEMCAFRVGVVREMPPALINDDAYLQILFELRGFRAGYCENAKVLLKGPSTLSELITQRRRIYIGHHQLRMYTGEKPPTIWAHARYRSLLLVGQALPSRGFRPLIYLVLSFFIESALYLLGKLDFHMGNLPYKWRMAETTKALRYGP